MPVFSRAGAPYHEQRRPQGLHLGTENAFLRHFINIEPIVLPSQARDKHRKELRATCSLQDQTEDPSAEDPTFYRSSVNLDAAWRAAGMRR